MIPAGLEPATYAIGKGGKRRCVEAAERRCTREHDGHGICLLCGRGEAPEAAAVEDLDGSRVIASGRSALGEPSLGRELELPSLEEGKTARLGDHGFT
ncbi:MAG TPA: hypothetical protein VNO30_43170 [Kofleriaceae bacterium]|nr:hypothetical protein [Kofleriaceae bacterium]